MAALSDKQLERIASALAEPRRFKILKDLSAHGVPMQCSAIVDCHGVSQATISHHLKKLRDAGIVAIPGVGFDVVPTDCLAAMLKRELPSATHLKLAFRSRHGGDSQRWSWRGVVRRGRRVLHRFAFSAVSEFAD